MMENGIHLCWLSYFFFIRLNGKKNGTGAYIFSNGDSYEGYFLNGLR